MEGKKISFGFKKVQRATDSRLPVPGSSIEPEERKDFIECVEENAIKIVGGERIEEKKLLVIPMKPNTMTAERFQQIATEVEDFIEDKDDSVTKVEEVPKIENETLEQQAARELLEEAKNIKKVDAQVLTLPVPTLPPLTGQKESTLEDYEAVPISDYGMAMLRGMGWNPGKAQKYIQPVLRPKGLGLGADKLVKKGAEKKKNSGDRRDEEIKLQNGCHVRIVAGKYSGAYGKVLSMNDESARATVELALGQGQVEIGEQLLEPISREVYHDRAKVINSDKYDEYKRKEQLKNDISYANKNNKNTDSHLGQEKNRRVNRIEHRERSSSESEQERKSREEYRNNHQRNNSGNGKEKRQNNDRKDRHTQNEVRSKSKQSPTSSSDRFRSESSLHSNSNDKEKLRQERKSRYSSVSSEDTKTKNKHTSKTKYKQNESSSIESDSSLDEKREKSKKKKGEKEKREIDKKRKGKKKRRDRDRSPNHRKHKK